MRLAHPPDAPGEVPAAWEALLTALPDCGRVLVLGASDRGKTTLCWWLAGKLAARGVVGLVDADVGQSRLGPPASVGWQVEAQGQAGFRFVGCVSPAQRPASLLRATVGACQACEAAGATLTVVDTTGYLSDATAIELKRAKIGQLRPVRVVTLGDEAALGDIMAPWLEDPRVWAHRLGVAPGARVRGTQTRSQWRQEHFAQWLAGANLRWIGAQGRRFRHMPRAEVYAQAPEQLEGLLLGFSDAAGNGLCVGLLHSVDWRGGRVLAWCPEAAEQAARVDFGCLRLRPDGSQLPAQ
jgi:polynucleotide 5'-hydroxyl-kinase GRC3/NOL9